MILQYPLQLKPHYVEPIKLSTGQVVSLPKAKPHFKSWRGPVAFDRYGNKPVLDLNGEPLFAELVILRLFEEAGWTGVWVDSYRRCYRSSSQNKVDLPEDKLTMLKRIRAKTGKQGGCFDVFVWLDEQMLFAESKREGHDRLRASQFKWIEAALNCGLSRESFLIVEWSLGESYNGRVLENRL